MIIGIIPAKGGSTRLPNKNMAPLNGRPMLDYTIDAALRSHRLDATFVSTDSEVIAEHAIGRGLQVVSRPPELCGDTPMNDVIRHVLDTIIEDRVSTVVCLQPDHPDRQLSVDEVIEALEASGADKLYCTAPDGTKNGAHYVTSCHFWDTGECRSEIVLIDDCTNIHFQEDLELAERKLTTRNS